MNHEAVNNFVEINLISDDNFLKVKETLTRIGVGSNDKKKLYQSCHILHKRGKYYIVHFKELFILDGKVDTFTEEDKMRRNTIIHLLSEFGLIELTDPDMIKNPEPDISKVKVIRFKDKDEWDLIQKYNVGR